MRTSLRPGKVLRVFQTYLFCVFQRSRKMIAQTILGIGGVAAFYGGNNLTVVVNNAVQIDKEVPRDHRYRY